MASPLCVPFQETAKSMAHPLGYRKWPWLWPAWGRSWTTVWDHFLAKLGLPRLGFSGECWGVVCNVGSPTDATWARVWILPPAPAQRFHLPNPEICSTPHNEPTLQHSRKILLATYMKYLELLWVTGEASPSQWCIAGLQLLDLMLIYSFCELSSARPSRALLCSISSKHLPRDKDILPPSLNEQLFTWMFCLTWPAARVWVWFSSRRSRDQIHQLLPQSVQVQVPGVEQMNQQDPRLAKGHSITHCSPRAGAFEGGLSFLIPAGACQTPEKGTALIFPDFGSKTGAFCFSHHPWLSSVTQSCTWRLVCPFFMPTLKLSKSVPAATFVIFWSLFLVNYKDASVRHSTAHPQNLEFHINGSVCPVNMSMSLNVSKPHLRGTTCLLNSQNSTKLILTKAFHSVGKYLQFMSYVPSKMAFFGQSITHQVPFLFSFVFFS